MKLSFSTKAQTGHFSCLVACLCNMYLIDSFNETQGLEPTPAPWKLYPLTTTLSDLSPSPIIVLVLLVVSIANAQSNGIPLQRSPLGQIHCIRYGVYVLGSIPACSLAGRQARRRQRPPRRRRATSSAAYATNAQWENMRKNGQEWRHTRFLRLFSLVAIGFGNLSDLDFDCFCLYYIIIQEKKKHSWPLKNKSNYSFCINWCSTVSIKKNQVLMWFFGCTDQSEFESRSISSILKFGLIFMNWHSKKCFFFTSALFHKRPIFVTIFRGFFIFDEIFQLNLHVSRITLHTHKITFWKISPMCGGHRAGTLLGAS